MASVAARSMTVVPVVVDSLSFVVPIVDFFALSIFSSFAII